MGLITLLSDFGYSDHYVAAMKAKILSYDTNIGIVDISHGIGLSDLAHAAYTLNSVFREFPEGTVHLVSINTTGHPDEKYIAVKLEGHYFICPDNGILGLISDQPAEVVIDITPSEIQTTFQAKDILCPVAAALASGTIIQDLGSSLESFKMMLPRHLRATKKQIIGNVLRVNHYGNLITNIDKTPFDILSKDKSFNIVYGRENSRRIHQYYGQVEPGDCFILFNSSGLLEIGINQGNASKLLGLSYDSPVMINFEE
jgi:S-adenosylmethionine hydrolase